MHDYSPELQNFIDTTAILVWNGDIKINVSPSQSEQLKDIKQPSDIVDLFPSQAHFLHGIIEGGEAPPCLEYMHDFGLLNEIEIEAEKTES